MKGHKKFQTPRILLHHDTIEDPEKHVSLCFLSFIRISQYFINCIYSFFHSHAEPCFCHDLLGRLVYFCLFQDHVGIVYVNEVDFKFTHIFSNSQESFVFVKWRIFSPQVLWILWKLKDCDKSQVEILIINALFAKIWLKIKVLYYFKSFSFVRSCMNEIHIFCFPSKLSFRFPFHSMFHSVPFFCFAF